jgi:quinohemoprotein ethanol dehydrogenase
MMKRLLLGSVLATACAVSLAAMTPDERRADAAIDHARLVAANAEQGNWLAHGRTYDEKRFSPLTQINDQNAQQLGLAWHYDTGHNRGLEATPIVINGVIYSTGNWSVVYANDARTGELLWQYDPQVDKSWAVHACCDVVNRGVAVWNGKVFVGTLDGRMVAIDAGTGQKVWETLTIDKAWPYTITGAPRVVKGKVIIGNGGAEYGVRGYITAYDTETGQQAWRFYTVPGNPADGFENELMKKIAETWSGEWWTGGGGGTVWDSMAYDPDLDLLYIGVGNAGPWNRYLRNPEGKDNLFTASIVAIRPDTGEYVWHYQETPNDGWDYTSTQHMILADIPWQGEQRKVILHAPKNGFFFVVDRENGKFLSAVPYARVNWALGYDANGRPIENPDVNYRDKPALVRPSPMGAHNWHPMSYSEQTHLVYIPVIDGMFQYGQDKNFKRHHGYWNTGTSTIELPPGEQLFQDVISRKVTSGSLLAWDPVKQQKVWEVQHPLTWNGGVLSTAGNLVFQGTADGRLVAYRADNGDKVWEYKTQAGVIAPPVTYSVDGEQYVTVMAGWGGAFGLTGGMPTPPGEPRSRILTFKLGGTAQLPALPPDQLFDPPPRMAVSDEQLKHGANVYNTFCVGCHGVNVVSNKSVPDLRWMAPPFHENFKPIVLGGALKGLGMVGFADVLNEQDADAVHAYILDKANDAKEKRDNPDSAWWLNLKTRTYETLGELMSKYL